MLGQFEQTLHNLGYGHQPQDSNKPQNMFFGLLGCHLRLLRVRCVYFSGALALPRRVVYQADNTPLVVTARVCLARESHSAVPGTYPLSD